MKFSTPFLFQKVKVNTSLICFFPNVRSVQVCNYFFLASKLAHLSKKCGNCRARSKYANYNQWCHKVCKSLKQSWWTRGRRERAWSIVSPEGRVWLAVKTTLTPKGFPCSFPKDEVENGSDLFGNTEQISKPPSRQCCVRFILNRRVVKEC